MKKFCSLLSLVAAVALLVGCEEAPVATGDGAAKSATPVAFAGEENVISFNVPGMTCEGCAAMVQDTLASTDGIEKCIVDLEGQVATCKVNPDKFKADDVIQALADAGYKDSTLKN